MLNLALIEEVLAKEVGKCHLQVLDNQDIDYKQFKQLVSELQEVRIAKCKAETKRMLSGEQIEAYMTKWSQS